MNIKDLLGNKYKEGMTVEEIETALADVEMPVDNSAEIDRLKTALSKSNSEAAESKRQLREKMSADEIKAKEDAEEMERLRAENANLVREKTISTYKASYLSIGYDDKLAEETAKAVVDGKFDKVIENQKKHLDAVEKKVRQDVLKDTPRPEGGSSAETMTKEKLRGMSVSERYEYSQAHPDEYKQIYGGN